MFINELSKSLEEDKKLPDNSLILLDITDTYITPEVRDLAKEQVELGKDKKFKVAILGASFIKRVITAALNKNLYFAKNKTDALDWLVKQKK